MKSGDALREFTTLLEARGTSAEALSVRDGIDAMLDFYRSTRADDCSFESDGDSLLFQWGTYDWGQGARFELDITRQFIPADGEDEDIFQLSLTFFFPANDIKNGDRWCNRLRDVDDFASFVTSHAAYAAALPAPPLRVELDFECAG